MNDITANIIVACQTSGAVASISKLKFAMAQLGRYAINFAAESISAFSELEESTQKFNVVFAGLGKQSKKVVDELISAYGQSELSAKNMLGTTGDLLTGFGVGKDQALGLAEAAAKLGADLASFSNYAGGAEGATNALTKAMLGERESLKLLGVVIREDDAAYKSLTKQAMTTGVTIKALNKTFKVDNLQQAKAVATLALAYQQSKNAIGDFARSSDSIANTTRSLENRFDELKASFGGFLNEFLRVGAIKGGLADSLAQITQTLKDKTPEWSLAINKFLISTQMGFKLIWSVGSNIMENIAVVGVYAYDVLCQAWKDAPGFFGAVWKDIVQTVQDAFNIHVSIYGGAFDFFNKVLASFARNWTGIFKDLSEVAFRYINGLRVLFVEFFKGIVATWGTLAKNLALMLAGKISAKDVWSGMEQTLTASYDRASKAIAKNWEGFSFSRHSKQFAEDVKQAGVDYGNQVVNATKTLRDNLTKNTTEYLKQNGVHMGNFKDVYAEVEAIITEYEKKIAALTKNASKNTKQKEATKKSLANSFIPDLSSVKGEFTKNRATAQRAIMAGSTEAISLQSRNFTANNYQDVMMRETKKQSSALESINRNTRDSRLHITSVKLG